MLHNRPSLKCTLYTEQYFLNPPCNIETLNLVLEALMLSYLRNWEQTKHHYFSSKSLRRAPRMYHHKLVDLRELVYSSLRVGENRTAR